MSCETIWKNSAGKKQYISDNTVIAGDCSYQKERHTDRYFQHCGKEQISRNRMVREYPESIQRDTSRASYTLNGGVCGFQKQSHGGRDSQAIEGMKS